MKSNQFGILPESISIPYGEDTRKRTLQQYVRKVANTILSNIAYRSRSNKLRILCHKLRGVHIGKNVYIGIHCTFDNLYPELIYLEDHAAVNAESMIVVHFNPYKAFSRVIKASASPVLVKKYGIVSVRSMLMPGSVVGECSIVSAGSVVYGQVEDRTIVRGNPAQKIGKLPKSIGTL